MFAEKAIDGGPKVDDRSNECFGNRTVRSFRHRARTARFRGMKRPSNGNTAHLCISDNAMCRRHRRGGSTNIPALACAIVIANAAVALV
jgi:hypothetical protein